MTSTTLICSGTDKSIRFGVGECSLGSILVVATGQSVCAISLGDNPVALVRELGGRFPTAELTKCALHEREAGA